MFLLVSPGIKFIKFSISKTNNITAPNEATPIDSNKGINNEKIMKKNELILCFFKRNFGIFINVLITDIFRLELKF